MIMYAVKGSVKYFKYIHLSMDQLRLYPKGYDKKIYKVEVSIHENQKINKNVQNYWGWVRTGSDKFSLIQPSYSQFTMNFAYGYRTNEKSGHGKAYRLKIKEVGIVK